MKLQKLILNNFKSFKHTTMTFPTGNGLSLITGINYENTTYGSNGIGKTTIFDAICYCLFGKGSQKQTAEELLRLGTKGGYSVQCVFDTGIITRTWKPISIQLDGRMVSQNEIEDFIGMNYDQFLNSIYFNQEAAYFLDMTSSSKLDLLSTVFDLDKWTTYADKAKEKAKDISVVLTPKLNALEANELFLGKQLEQLKATEAKVTLYEESKQKSLAEILQQIEKAEKDQSEWELFYEKDKKEKQAKIAKLQAEIKPEIDIIETQNCATQIKDLISSNLSQQSDVTGKINHTNLLLNTLETNIKNTQDRIQKLEGLSGECPTCLQQVEPSHKHSISAELNKHIATDLAAKEALLKTVDNLKLQLEKLKTENAENNELLQEVQKKLAEFGKIALTNETNKKWIADLTAELNKPKFNPYDSAVNAQLQQKIILENKENPYTEELSQLATATTDLATQCETQKALLKGDQEKMAGYEFWKTQFPKIRIAILDEITTDLEMHFNQALCNLSLMEWSVEVSSTKTLKNEKQKSELVINLFHNGAQRSLASLSGAEKQRIRIASAIAVSNLIKERLGVIWDLQLWDEPSNHLSKEALSSMLEFFENISTTSQVIVADPSIQPDRSCFDKIFYIVKDTLGNSSLSQQLPTLTPQLASIP
jgi:DNA repair exonuclease SbcCD ATPase subunit